jgi:RNA polymerase sigma-70 factor, ECF subfamily
VVKVLALVRGRDTLTPVEGWSVLSTSSSAEPNEEQRLVARATRRDSAAFGVLYESHLDRVYRYIYYRVGSTAEVEDLAEQVFLKAWEAIDRYEPRGVPFVAWLYRLAHNLVIDHYRARRPTLPLEDVGEAEEPGVNILDAVESQVDAEAVRQAVRKLSPEHQQLLVLRFVEGMSHAEVAQITGKSEGATRVVQYRALQSLAKAMQGERETSKGARR